MLLAFTRFLAFALFALAARAEFRAAAVKVDITPKTPQWLMGYGARQSTGVHDPIFHRIAALDDGSTQAPEDKPYGHRNAGVIDQNGITWWIGSPVNSS
jgi:uncharacterized glyoxalase superfamily protein PhnB